MQPFSLLSNIIKDLAQTKKKAKSLTEDERRKPSPFFLGKRDPKKTSKSCAAKATIKASMKIMNYIIRSILALISRKAALLCPNRRSLNFPSLLFLYFMMLVGGKINLSWNYCTTKVHLTISDKWHFPTRLKKNILAIFLTQISQPVFLKKFILAESERKLQKVIC